MHVQNTEKKKTRISCMLLYQTLPHFQSESLNQRLKDTFGDQTQSIISRTDANASLVIISFGKDTLMITGLYVPYPHDVLDRILPACHFEQTEKNAFYHNKAHILLSYSGQEAPPHVQYSRIYQSIDCLLAEDNHALGIVHEASMTAHPVHLLDSLRKERPLLKTPRTMPFMSWMAWTGGCIKYIQNVHTIWFITQGNHTFGLPELAFKGHPEQGPATLKLFNALFAYMYLYKAKLVVGHIANLGSKRLTFTASTDYSHLSEGKYGTLVVHVCE